MFEYFVACQQLVEFKKFVGSWLNFSGDCRGYDETHQVLSFETGKCLK